MTNITKRFISTLSSTSSSFTEIYNTIKQLILNGKYNQALKLYTGKIHSHASNTTFLLPSIIKSCAHTQTHQLLGYQLHCYVLKNGYSSESAISNSFISMYAKFGKTEDASQLFDKMPQRDTISWNSMISCYYSNGYLLESLELFKEMYIENFVPKPELIASVLSACVQTKNLRLGRAIHGLTIVDEKIESSVFLTTALVDFYWKCCEPDLAFRVFRGMEVKNEVSWTAMVSGCIAEEMYAKAIELFRVMQLENVKPNRVTLTSILPACAHLGALKYGKQIHGYAFRYGFDLDSKFSSAIVHMYSECGEALRAVKSIFDRSTKKDVVMWTAIITCYSRNKSSCREAIRLFNEMQLTGTQPNDVTLLAVVSACTNLLSVRHGRGTHGYAFRSGLSSHLFIGNSLINMYSKCGFLKDSAQVFEEMSIRDSASWSALISAYGTHGSGDKALELFHEMKGRGIKTDSIALLAVLLACNHCGLFEEGKKLFEALKDKSFSITVELYACYIDLLGRAGKLEDASEVISGMPMKPSDRIWSSLISSCKLHGRLEVAERLAHRLTKSEPENAANYGLLSLVYAESENWPGVEDVRRDMKERKLRKSYGFSRIELDD
ncbi:pentatricopeptide repeat-containing protein At4g31070, mitochondrial [Lycium barbarum]|uniref:pentatricopeptide repeat-containing protein At4g31070, mitochondrial n=1 Tax=Lycium barbarum TaxID=112863 RepID=UPI00293E5A0C|nr:pentatricopeptide repeat-containing protein At4g31070, mitochondrial [Lycium barbarum]